MKEIIEKILEEEKQARERVDGAREKAKQIRIEAEKESKKILEEIQQKGREEAKALIAQAEGEAKEQREEELRGAARLDQTLWNEKKQDIEDTVEVLFRMVLGEDVS